MRYRLAIDGDDIEKKCWDLFIQEQFPSYELFWIKHVVPLTNRPYNIHFKTDTQLYEIGKTTNDICIAQLHYSILKHLLKTYAILNTQGIDIDNLTDGIIRICCAQDLAFELLERFKNPPKYKAWNKKNSEKAREAWQKLHSFPLQNIRRYRNYLIHGHAMPAILNKAYYLPKIGKEDKYFDWRLITDPKNNSGFDFEDFSKAKYILKYAWDETINYIESNWEKYILLLNKDYLETISPPITGTGFFDYN